MSMAQSIVAELQAESALTRGLLEVIPENKMSFQAHPRSMSIGQVASHIVETFTWTDAMVGMDEFEMDPAQYKPWIASSKRELLEAFDRNVAPAIDKVRPLSDKQLIETWSMSVAGKKVIIMPRGGVLKMMLVNHVVHHRGQLDVYLRLIDVPLPSIYGPTADRPNMG